MKAKEVAAAAAHKARFALGYGGYVATNLIFIPIALAVGAATLPWPGLRRRALSSLLRAVLRAFVFGYLDMLGICSVRVIGEAPKPGRPAVIISNHRSFLDPLILLATCPGAGILVKSRYSSWLAIWVLIRMFDFASIDRSSLASLAGAAEKCREIMAGGRSVIIFPEGTRSPSARMGEFKSLAFRLARETGAPVAPAAICSDAPFMAKTPGSFAPRSKIGFTLEFLAPLYPEKFKDAGALSNASYRTIASALSRAGRRSAGEASEK